MATEILAKVLHGSMVPMDKASYDIFDSLTNTVVKLSIVKDRKLNSDDINDEQRSVAQNRLMWAWLTDMQNTTVNEHSGKTKDEWHIEMKRKFLLNIFARDCQEYAETVQCLTDVYKNGMEHQFEKMADFVAEKTESKKGTVKQLVEYLTCIESYCHGLGISLRTDNEMYKLAMNPEL